MQTPRFFRTGFQRLAGVDGVGQLGALAHDLLRGGRVVPEIGVFGFRVQFVQTEQGVIPVKDASGAR